MTIEATVIYSTRQKLLAEFVGTAGLLCAVIGSGIMAERLSGGNIGIALLANTLATVFALYVLIETLGPISGAHLNPVVTLVLLRVQTQGPVSKLTLVPGSSSKSPQVPVNHQQLAILFIVFQLLGAVAGAWLVHLMFDLPLLQFSTHLRGGLDATGQFTGWGQCCPPRPWNVWKYPACSSSAKWWT